MIKTYTIKCGYPYTSKNEVEISSEDLLYAEINTTHSGVQCNNNKNSEIIRKKCGQISDLIREIDKLNTCEGKYSNELQEACNLHNVTTRFSANEIENVMRKVKKAKISHYLKQILQRATGDSYDSADDKAFLDKYTGKVANVYEWAGDWWIAEDDNYVITEDCFTIL